MSTSSHRIERELRRDPLGDRWSWACSCGQWGKSEFSDPKDADAAGREHVREAVSNGE